MHQKQRRRKQYTRKDIVVSTGSIYQDAQEEEIKIGISPLPPGQDNESSVKEIRRRRRKEKVSRGHTTKNETTLSTRITLEINHGFT